MSRNVGSTAPQIGSPRLSWLHHQARDCVPNCSQQGREGCIVTEIGVDHGACHIIARSGFDGIERPGTEYELAYSIGILFEHGGDAVDSSRLNILIPGSFSSGWRWRGGFLCYYSRLAVDF